MKPTFLVKLPNSDNKDQINFKSNENLKQKVESKSDILIDHSNNNKQNSNEKKIKHTINSSEKDLDNKSSIEKNQVKQKPFIISEKSMNVLKELFSNPSSGKKLILVNENPDEKRVKNNIPRILNKDYHSPSIDHGGKYISPEIVPSLSLIKENKDDENKHFSNNEFIIHSNNSKKIRSFNSNLKSDINFKKDYDFNSNLEHKVIYLERPKLLKKDFENKNDLNEIDLGPILFPDKVKEYSSNLNESSQDLIGSSLNTNKDLNFNNKILLKAEGYNIFLETSDYSNSNLSAALYATILSTLNDSSKKDEYIKVYFNSFKEFIMKSHHKVNLLKFIYETLNNYHSLKHYFETNFIKKISSIYKSEKVNVESIHGIYQEYNEIMINISKSAIDKIIEELSILDGMISKNNDYINSPQQTNINSVLKPSCSIVRLFKYLKEVKLLNNTNKILSKNAGSFSKTISRKSYDLLESLNKEVDNNIFDSEKEINNINNDILLADKLTDTIDNLEKNLNKYFKLYPHLLNIILDKQNSEKILTNKDSKIKSIYHIFSSDKKDEFADEFKNSENIDEEPITSLIGRKKAYKANEIVITSIGKSIGNFLVFLKTNLLTKLDEK